MEKTKKSIGILYLCTGDYSLLWKDFYSSAEEKFLPDTLKNYYVFTDKPESITKAENVKAYYIDPLPWPLITLLRFYYFLRFREEFANNDYLVFINSNAMCCELIREEDFLPAPDQELSVVSHPVYYRKKACHTIYERSRHSTAYVPYNCARGGGYMFGALICGHKDNFMHMSEILSERINKDLDNRKIAIWHDESQYNRYLLEGHKVRILSPSYGYPEDWKLPFEKKIELRDKAKHFDVGEFKSGVKSSSIKKKSRIRNFIEYIISGTSRYIKDDICFIRDTLLFRHI